MTAHAILAPSSAHVWGPGGCPASPRMAAAYPEDEESPEAREGTAAHYYATEALAGREVALGSLAPNGHPIDQGMIDYAAGFVDDVRRTVETNPGELFVESRVRMGAYVHSENWGTPDAYLLHFPRKVLFLWDYKYGHRPVEVFECWQLLDYAIGAFYESGVDREHWGEWKIVLTVCQPRSFHADGAVREWQLSGAELARYAGLLAVAASLTNDPAAPMKSGAYCLDCSAVTHCPAAMENALRFVDVAKRAQPFNLPPHALGLALVILREGEKRIKAMRVGLEEEALRAFRMGGDVPLWCVTNSEGREKWNVPASHVFALGDTFGVDLHKPAEPITPAQARKAGVDPVAVAAFAEKPKGGLVLKPFDNQAVSKSFS